MARTPDEGGLTRAERIFARQVRELREQKGWSQGELAERMREYELPYVNQTTVSRIENLSRPVRMIEAQILSRLFEVSVATMMDPDSREGWLHAAAQGERAARRQLAAFKNSARAAAGAQARLRRDLADLRSDFGDRATLDVESRALYDHLLLNMSSFADMDLLEIARAEIEAGRAAGERENSISVAGLAHFLATSVGEQGPAESLPS